MAEEPGAWRWTVTRRFPMNPMQGPRVVVIGDHTGAWPTNGEQVVIRDGDRIVSATVDCVMRFEQREGGDVSGYAWALALRDVALDDVVVGAVVVSEQNDPAGE